MLTPQLSATSPSAPWPKAKGDTATPEPLVVEIAARKDELLLDVQIVVSLLGAWNNWETVDSISASETLHHVTFVHEGSCDISQNFSLAGVRAKPLVPNPSLPYSLLQAEHVEAGEEESKLVKTIQAGCAYDSSTQVTKVMDTQKGLSAPTMSAEERVALLHNEPPPSLDAALASTPQAIPEPTISEATTIPGLFFAETIFEACDFDGFLDSINKAPGNWDASRKRHKRDFGFALNCVGEIVRPAPPHPGCVCPPLEVSHGNGHPKRPWRPSPRHPIKCRSTPMRHQLELVPT